MVALASRVRGGGGRGEERLPDLRRSRARARTGGLRRSGPRDEPARRDPARDDPRRRDAHPRRRAISSTTSVSIATRRRPRRRTSTRARSRCGTPSGGSPAGGRASPAERGCPIPDAVTTLIRLELRGTRRRANGASTAVRSPRSHLGACHRRRAVGRGMTGSSEGPCATTLPVDTQEHAPGACMPEGLPPTRDASCSARSRTIWPSSGGCHRTRSRPIGVDLEQLATFLTRNRSSLGDRAVPAPAALPRPAAHARLRARDDRAARRGDQDVLPLGGRGGACRDGPVAPPRAPQGREPTPDGAPPERGRGARRGAGRSRVTAIPWSTPSRSATAPPSSSSTAPGCAWGRSRPSPWTGST